MKNLAKTWLVNVRKSDELLQVKQIGQLVTHSCCWCNFVCMNLAFECLNTLTCCKETWISAGICMYITDFFGAEQNIPACCYIVDLYMDIRWKIQLIKDRWTCCLYTLYVSRFISKRCGYRRQAHFQLPVAVNSFFPHDLTCCWCCLNSTSCFFVCNDYAACVIRRLHCSTKISEHYGETLS
jgi:hypothetical protein